MRWEAELNEFMFTIFPSTSQNTNPYANWTFLLKINYFLKICTLYKNWTQINRNEQVTKYLLEGEQKNSTQTAPSVRDLCSGLLPLLGLSLQPSHDQTPSNISRSKKPCLALALAGLRPWPFHCRFFWSSVRCTRCGSVLHEGVFEHLAFAWSIVLRPLHCRTYCVVLNNSMLGPLTLIRAWTLEPTWKLAIAIFSFQDVWRCP